MNRTALLERVASLYPRPVDAGPELDRALGFLGADVGAETVVRAGYVAVVPAAFLGLAGWLAAFPGRPAVAVAFAVGTGAAAAHLVRRLPLALATVRRTQALGETTALVGRMALRMRVDPTPERAAQFAARTGRGPLAASLNDHTRRARGGPQTGLGSFAAEWREWFPALERAAALIAASADAPPGERERGLDRAFEAVRRGTRDRMAAFADDVRGPVNGVYAFGVLLPTALVGMLPAARAAGVAVGVEHVVVAYDLLLPAALVAANAWLFLNRPVAFPPPDVDRDHPDVPDGPGTALFACVAVGGIAAAAGRALVASWAGPVAAVGAGAGAALVVRYRPVKRVRDRAHAVESGLEDALYLVGRRVSEGEAVEPAVAAAGEELPGATGDVFADAAGVQRRLRIGVREAFLGDGGALADVPSPRTRSAAALLALAAREGEPAGGAVVATAEQLGELRRVESEARRELGRVTRTLANTAAIFAPLVGGATVALVAGMSARSTGRFGGALPVEALGPAIGGYVLLLAVVLTALAAGLEHGLDRAIVGYRSGWALLSATATYLAAFVGAGTVL